MTQPNARDKIIDAAMDVVARQGVARLTLDEAARAAGLSKGGVLYHFKSKDDLIRAMVQRLIDQCDTLHHMHYQQESPGPYRWARTVVRTALHPDGPADDPIAGAMLAAIAVNPELMAPLQAKYAEWVARVRSDSPDPERAALVCLAMDGYVLRRMLGLRVCSDGEMSAIGRKALDLLK